MGNIVDLYAGPGGWSEALRALGRGEDELGVELDDAACATRAAAGHRTLQADIGDLQLQPFATDLEGLIASPPCQGFSSAGKGAARDLMPELLASIHARRWNDRADPDPRVWLIVNLGRWLERLTPRWIALEQVPSVLPIWQAYADLLRSRDYSVWTGILNAADFGVPQTRQRAILIASRDRIVHPPEPTHARDPIPSLFGTLDPWVTMGAALGLGPSEKVGFPRLDDRGDSPDGYRERDWRAADQPSFAVTEKARSWILETGSRTELAGGEKEYTRETDRPSPTIRQSKSWIFDRPATTVIGDPRLGDPGHRDRAGGEPQFRPGAIRLTITQALILQSFRPDYPVQGGKTKQFEQIGNAIPPRLAEHVLRSVLP